MAYVKKNAIAGREFSGWAEFVAHLVRWTREVADLRVHGTTCEVPLERFLRSEAQALQPLEAKPSFLAERELARIMHSDCCVEVEVNWYSAPQALIRQRVSVLCVINRWQCSPSCGCPLSVCACAGGVQVRAKLSIEPARIRELAKAQGQHHLEDRLTPYARCPPLMIDER